MLQLVASVAAATRGAEDVVNVHVVTHTHDDVGWLNTVDEYYVRQVRWILETATRALEENPARKFTYVELAFFRRWWDEIDEPRRARVRALAASGQLQFNLAGWCMNDEAATWYVDEINQQSEGAMWLLNNVGPAARARVGWHIDPFGHSASTPTLWAMLGHDAFGGNRIHYADKDRRKAAKELEFVWTGSKSAELGPRYAMWTHLMDSHYCTPDEVSFDGGRDINWNPTLATYGVDVNETARRFINTALARSRFYRHGEVLIPFGCDFSHTNAFDSFMQMDRVIAAVNALPTPSGQPTVRAKYSTFADYMLAVHALNISFPTFGGDFFPYADNPRAYWTGYYTSRPDVKGAVRANSAALRAHEALNVLGTAVGGEDPPGMTWADTWRGLESLRRALGVAQHHDGVSGTEKQHVADDYLAQLATGAAAALPVGQARYQQVAARDPAAPALPAGAVWVADVSAAAAAAGGAGGVVGVVPVVNVLARQRYIPVAVPCGARTDLVVATADGRPVASQITLALAGAGPSALANNTLWFIADTPALGTATYLLLGGQAAHTVPRSALPPGTAPAPVSGGMTASFDTDGMLAAVAAPGGAAVATVARLFAWRSSSDADDGMKPSGAYAFRPAQDWSFQLAANPAGGAVTVIHPFPNPRGVPSCVVVLAGHSLADFTDTIVGSLSGVAPNCSGISVSAARVGGTKTWGQQPALGFFTCPPGVGDGYECGQTRVPPGPAGTAVEVRFSRALAGVPLVFVTAMAPAGSVVPVSLTAVSATGATAVVGAAGAYALNFVAVTRDAVGMLWPGAIVADATVPVPTGEVTVPFATAMPPYQWRPGMLVGGVVTGTAGACALGLTAASRDSLSYGIGANVVPASGMAAGCSGGTAALWAVAYPREPIGATVTGSKGAPSVTVAAGPVVTEVASVWSATYAVMTRVFSAPQGGAPYVEVELQVGPLDAGSELTVQVETDLAGATLQADTNGYEMQTRAAALNTSELISGNYWPFVSSIVASAASGRSLVVLAERAHGLGLPPGEGGAFEMMVHRSCLQDDGYGVGEVLVSPVNVRPKFWFAPAASFSDASDVHRRLVHELNAHPLLLAATAPSAAAWGSAFQPTTTAVAAPLPPNVHLLSLQARNASSSAEYIIRWEHLYATGENPAYATPVSFNVSAALGDALPGVAAAVDTLLGGDAARATTPARLSWRTDDGRMLPTQKPGGQKARESGDMVSLVPREIRTMVANSLMGGKRRA